MHRKLEELLEDDKEGSHNLEESVDAIRGFIESLSKEEPRHVQEGCTEEELAVFDPPTKPGIELEKKERQQVKELLTKLKASNFTLARRKQANREVEARRSRCSHVRRGGRSG